LNIFYKFSEPFRSACKIEIPLKIPLPPELTEGPVTLGDHLHRRRLELGLYQKDVASRLGVTTSSVWNWEHGWTIDLRYIPRIIAFLGYNPIHCPEDLLERLAWHKQVNGLTLEKLGAEMGCDPEQLADWLAGRHKPCRRNQKKIGLFLSGHVQGFAGDRIIGTN
jgi:transcriptional regulator with XRE-family HTH domain